MKRVLLTDAIALGMAHPYLSTEAVKADMEAREGPKLEPVDVPPDTMQGFEFDIGALFHVAYTRLGMKRQGGNRLQGKHCVARLQRAKTRKK